MELYPAALQEGWLKQNGKMLEQASLGFAHKDNVENLHFIMSNVTIKLKVENPSV